jgi:hypothetical protein
MPNTVIQLKKSSTPGSSPSSGNLANGELAINFADGVIYYKNLVGQVAQFIAPGRNFGTVNANGTLLVSAIAGDVFTILPGQNITVTGDAVNDRVTIGADLTSANGWANTKLSNGTVTLAGALTTTGSIYANGVIYVTPVGGQEGGEIKLQSTGSNTNWNMDSYQNNFRLFAESGTTVSNVNFFHAIGGGSIRMGVNRADPGYTLDVNGIVNASAIYVNGAPMSSGSMDYPYANLVGSSANAASSANDASQGANIAVLAASFVSNSQSLSANVNTLAATFASANANNISLSANVNVLAAVAAAALANTSGVSFNGNLNFPTGNVGIGNTAPDARLHVAGTTILGGDTVGTMDVKFSRLLSGTRVINHWFSHSANSPWYLFGQNMTWNGERTGTVDPTHAHRPYYEAYAPVVGYKEFGFANVSSGSIASSNLIANMVLTNTGNVGIGTASPSAKLHVSGGYTILADHNTQSVPTAALGATALSWNYSGGSAEINFWNLWTSAVGGGFRFSQKTGTSTFNDIYWAANTSHIWYTTGTERMRIDANGNIGIGTTTPSGQLTLASATANRNGIHFRATGWNSIGRLGFNGTSGGELIQSYNWNANAGTVDDSSYATSYIKVMSGYLIFGTAGTNTVPSERMRIDYDGNVGIGTTSPAYKLDVAGTINALSTAGDGNGIRVTATAGYDSWINLYRQGYVNWYFGTINNSTRLDIKNDSLTAMSIAGSTGYVGIGTTTPAYKLHVNGSFAANTKSFVIDHPTKPGMKLRYGSLEGPENGVYVRGKIEGNVIELPDYWEGLVDLNTITVQLTAIGHAQNLYVAAIDGLKIHIDTENHTQPYCFYHIYGERKDVEKLVVEFEA